MSLGFGFVDSFLSKPFSCYNIRAFVPSHTRADTLTLPFIGNVIGKFKKITKKKRLVSEFKTLWFFGFRFYCFS